MPRRERRKMILEAANRVSGAMVRCLKFKKQTLGACSVHSLKQVKNTSSWKNQALPVTWKWRMRNMQHTHKIPLALKDLKPWRKAGVV